MGIDEIYLKCDRNDGIIVKDIREAILYSFGLDKPRGHKIFKNQ